MRTDSECARQKGIVNLQMAKQKFAVAKGLVQGGPACLGWILTDNLIIWPTGHMMPGSCAMSTPTQSY